MNNYSKSGDNEDKIGAVLQKTLDDILSGNNDCSKWLTGSEFSGAAYVRAILNDGEPTFGHGLFNVDTISTFVGGKLPSGPVPGSRLTARSR